MQTQHNIWNNVRLKRWLHTLVWLAILLSSVALFSYFYRFPHSFIRGLGNILPLAGLFYINIYLLERFFEKRNYLQYAIGIILALWAVATIRFNINVSLPDLDLNFLNQNKRLSFQWVTILTNLGVLGISALYQLIENRYKIERRNLEIINEQREAQLQFLRAQINPHFLFNTLNNIYSLAVVKSDKTAGMVLQLSNLLRYVIYESQAEQVPLTNEINQIKQFIHLFQMRSEEELDIRFNTDGVDDTHLLEPMILIPIVENCFKHCDFETNEKAFVRIELRVVENGLHFSTVNSKNDSDQQKDDVGGVGLENIRKRLNLKYGDRYELNIINQPVQFKVQFTLNMLDQTTE